MFFSLDDGATKFTDLIHLVEFYQLNRGVLPCKLKHPCTAVALWHPQRPCLLLAFFPPSFYLHTFHPKTPPLPPATILPSAPPLTVTMRMLRRRRKVGVASLGRRVQMEQRHMSPAAWWPRQEDDLAALRPDGAMAPPAGGWGGGNGHLLPLPHWSSGIGWEPLWVRSKKKTNKKKPWSRSFLNLCSPVWISWKPPPNYTPMGATKTKQKTQLNASWPTTRLVRPWFSFSSSAKHKGSVRSWARQKRRSRKRE